MIFRTISAFAKIMNFWTKKYFCIVKLKVLNKKMM